LLWYCCIATDMLGVGGSEFDPVGEYNACWEGMSYIPIWPYAVFPAALSALSMLMARSLEESPPVVAMFAMVCTYMIISDWGVDIKVHTCCYTYLLKHLTI
jgi:hypothetical protein